MAVTPDIIDIIDEGTNKDISPIAHKTKKPPQNEEPMYIYTYKENENTHTGAYYKGERLDYYPESIADATWSTMSTLFSRISGVRVPSSAADVPAKYRTEANIPENSSDIECYAIYPSQLGVSSDKLLKSIKEVKSDGSQYNFISNNCADQIEKVLNKVGIDTSNLQTFGMKHFTMPANINNFAKANGYKVKFGDIPFNNDEIDLIIALKWLKDPDKAYAELPDILKKNHFTSQFITQYLENAKNNPSQIAKEVISIIDKNKKLDKSHMMYCQLCNLPEDTRQILIDNGINNVLKDINPRYALHTKKSDQTTSFGNRLLAEVLKNQSKSSLKNSQALNNLRNYVDDTNIDRRIKAKKKTKIQYSPDLINSNTGRG